MDKIRDLLDGKTFFLYNAYVCVSVSMFECVCM